MFHDHCLLADQHQDETIEHDNSAEWIMQIILMSIENDTLSQSSEENNLNTEECVSFWDQNESHLSSMMNMEHFTLVNFISNNSYICQESERNLLNRNMQKCKTLILMMMISVGNSWTLKNNFTKRQEWKLWRNTESVLSENVKKNSISCICSFWKSQWIHLKKYGEESQRFRNEKKWNDWDSSVIVILMHTEIDGHELYMWKQKNDSFQYMSETKMKKTFYFWQNINIIPLHYH